MSLDIKKIRWINKNWDFDFPVRGVINLEGRFVDFDKVFYIQNFRKLSNGGIEKLHNNKFRLTWTCDNGSHYISARNRKDFTTIEEAKEAAQEKCEDMVNKYLLKYYDKPPKRKVLVEKSKKKIARKNKRRPTFYTDTGRPVHRINAQWRVVL